jgi:nucleoside-diphosphate-sugar epimerase
MRVVVTGAGGMVGCAVTRALQARTADIRAHVGPAGADTAAVPRGVPASFAEITDTAALRGLFDAADAVVHVAGPPSAAASFASPVAYANAHVVGTAAVLEACRSAGVSRLVLMSSAEVYGRPSQNPVSEDAATLPRSPYGAAKLGGEALVRAFCPPAGLAAAVLRPFSVYGPRSPQQSIVGRLLRSALTDDVITLSSLRPVRDYVHVDDVGEAAAAALRAVDVPNGRVPVWNVASGVGTSVAELAGLVLAAAGRSARVEEAPAPDRPPGADVTELVADISRAADDLGWVPAVRLAAGLAEALAAVRASPAPHP